MERKATGLSIDIDLWRKVKKECVNQETKIYLFLENLLKDYFKKKEDLYAIA